MRGMITFLYAALPKNCFGCCLRKNVFTHKDIIHAICIVMCQRLFYIDKLNHVHNLLWHHVSCYKEHYRSILDRCSECQVPTYRLIFTSNMPDLTQISLPSMVRECKMSYIHCHRSAHPHMNK